MRKLLVTILTLSAALTPLACIAGLFAHPCYACVDEAACSHEEICEDDPCSTQALRPEVPARGVPSDPSLLGGLPSRTGDLMVDRAELATESPPLGQRPSDLRSCDRNLPLLI